MCKSSRVVNGKLCREDTRDIENPGCVVFWREKMTIMMSSKPLKKKCRGWASLKTE